MKIPEGWKIEELDGRVVVSNEHGGYAATEDPDNIASTILARLARALLMTAASAQSAVRITHWADGEWTLEDGCKLCGIQMSIPRGHEPTEICHECAHKEVDRLTAIMEAQSAAGAEARLLNPAELQALSRFEETTSDEGTYDIGDEMVQRLAVIGVLRKVRGDQYELTECGNAMLARPAPPAVPEGMVPREPTEAMQQAGVAEIRNKYWEGTDYSRVCAIYRAMLAVAPAAVLELDAPTYVPGLWRCAKCKLDLIASVLYTKSGTMGANTAPQQCPNECGPMWRVSETDYRREILKSHGEMADQVRACGEAMERDRTNLAEAVTAAKKVLAAHEWLRLGRGSYEYNDDRWRDEFATAYEGITTALKSVETIMADWTHCPKKAVDVAEARANWKQKFNDHTVSVSLFLNELYAIMVDPCSDGTMSVNDVKNALVVAAKRDRETAAALQGAIAVPREDLERWRVYLSQGDNAPRFEIERLLASVPK